GVVVLIVVVGGIVWIVSALPTLSVIPPEAIIQGATGGIPDADAMRIESPEERNLVKRGQYIYTIASCAFCHNPNGSGGQKISWRPFGTVWTRNLTSEARTGIGSWSDQQIARAIRSGISADGRVLHWQAMIWDHASNWDEEDLRAVISYLRRLPPVDHQVPKARAPAEDDCVVYTFWVQSNELPGCH
ncbi:MAG TPA: cytochrome c, partial [Vicinamibacterales bacterium]|nr:cytochrome c [Vicinamibacterales bacterium]